MNPRWLVLILIVVLLVGALFASTTCGGCSGEAEKPPQRTPTPVDPATAGSIKGIVLFEGTPPERLPLSIGGDPVCAKATPPLDERAIVWSEDGRQVVQNAFVWIKAGLPAGFVPAVPETPVVVDQQGCIFIPHVVGVQRYQTIRYTNSDPTEHNVKFVDPRNNPAHDVTMSAQGQKIEFWFPQQEVMMKVICSKHSWMRNWVAVVDHPYFAVTGKSGRFDLTGVPPGTYTVACWTEAFGEKEQSVTLDPRGSQSIELSFSERK
jgi:plastocyanin